MKIEEAILQLPNLKKYFPYANFSIKENKSSALQPQLLMELEGKNYCEFLMSSDDLLFLAIKCHGNIKRQLGIDLGIQRGRCSMSDDIKDLLNIF